MPLTPQQFEAVLSADRFGRYVNWCATSAEAMALYTLNGALSESFYTPLHILEIVLRNRIHAVLGAAHGDNWVTGAGPFLNDFQMDEIAKTAKRITDEGKQVTPARMVAALNLGFWISLLNAKQDNLWQTTLNAIASKPNGKGCTRKELKSPLERIRGLRNRIAHHEPILHLNLQAIHDDIQMVCGWLNPDAETWLVEQSRFAFVYPQGGIVLLAQPAQAGL